MQREISVTMRSRLLGVAIGFVVGLAACGDDDPYVPDAAPDDQTFTAFVIDLVNNHTGDEAPVAYETFSDLPDPDGDNNNVVAFEALFQ